MIVTSALRKRVTVSTNSTHETAAETLIRSIGTTAVEIARFVLPIAIGYGVLIWRLDLQYPTVSWFLLGWGSLAIGVGLGRSDATRFGIAEWSRSDDPADRVTLVIAANGVLVLSVVITEVGWQVTGRPFVSAGLAIVLPIWYLKHVRVILALDSNG